MSERARIISWWVYVALVVVIFEGTWLLSGNFAYAVVAALSGIAGLCIALKAIVRRLTRKGRKRNSGATGGPVG